MEGPTSKKKNEPPKRANHKGNIEALVELFIFILFHDIIIGKIIIIIIRPVFKKQILVGVGRIFFC
jgi:hypothetical protein